MQQARAVTELGDGEEAVLVEKVEGVVGQQRRVLVLLWREYSGGHGGSAYRPVPFLLVLRCRRFTNDLLCTVWLSHSFAC